ncbi:MAG: hypothetical protein MUF36_04630 [Bacteroidales bacterium]|jgi:hypothetical protein|nr:hypothetical protein [Bacteroidales bacterium]
MKTIDNVLKRHREHHPQISIGLFFILLGVALLTAFNDWLNLGSVKEYFTWESALIFTGVLLLVNLNFVGGLALISIGGWFWIDDRLGYIPDLMKTIYWPSVIVLAGIFFIISSFVKRRKRLQ